MNRDASISGPKYEAGGRLPAAIEIFSVELSETRAVLEAEEQQTPRLAPDENTRFERKAVALGVEDAHQWRAAHIALRLVLEWFAGPSLRRIPYELSQSGRPRITKSLDLKTAPEFSLTHAGNSALIAISRTGPVGIDLEVPRKLRMPEERRLRIERAASKLAPHLPLPAEADGRLLQSWVRLEALAKATGLGIGRILTQARVFGEQQTGAQSHELSLEFRVADLAAGTDRFAAVSAPHLPEILAIRPIPSTADALEAFKRRTAHD